VCVIARGPGAAASNRQDPAPSHRRYRTYRSLARGGSPPLSAESGPASRARHGPWSGPCLHKRRKCRLCSPPFLLAPVLFRLTLHCRRVRVLHLDPVARTPRAAARAQPLRDNAFEPELVGMTKHHVARLGDVVVELQPCPPLGDEPR